MEATALAAATMLKKPAADVVENTANNSPIKPSQVVGEVPLLAQMQQAMDRLDDVMKRQDVGDVVVTRKQSCLLKDHIEPRPDFANVKFSLKNRFRCCFASATQLASKCDIRCLRDLKQKCVAVIGLGGIGALVAEMFTRTGVGKLTLIDHELDAEILLDVLQDCKLDQSSTADKPNRHHANHGTSTHMQFRLPMDAIICCVDNSTARRRVNQIALKLSIPLIDVTLSPCSSFITVQTILPGYSACMHCHWNDKYEAEAMVADAVSRQCPATLPQCELIAAGLVSQSTIKLLLEFGDQIPFYRLNCLDMDISTFWFKPNHECSEPMCKLKQAEYQLDVEKKQELDTQALQRAQAHDDDDVIHGS
ncbi:hypothetical protein DYB31_006486 [Aphanomyces astaci]|uniref:Ubiquitin-like modifier-activating enzyme 5 n=1 Tax=Aphanomyces astaci TaxID=112090 RepID=A0A397F393_APHAT|nr:hypothetical protein DYB31_006486 [Aphanomyces astaci]